MPRLKPPPVHACMLAYADLDMRARHQGLARSCVHINAVQCVSGEQTGDQLLPRIWIRDVLFPAETQPPCRALRSYPGAGHHMAAGRSSVASPCRSKISS